MKKEIIDRTLRESSYIIKTEQTVREISKKFNVSKSTVHKDLSERLKDIDNKKYLLVTRILKKHIDIRHIKGGESTKNKYKKLK